MTDEDGAGPGEDDTPPAAGLRGTSNEDTATPENHGTDEEQLETPPASRDREEPTQDDEHGGNVAGMLARDQPLEPGTIDVENALFVLIGVVMVVGFLVLAIAGL